MNGHVAVISKVGINAGTRVINPNNVIFIECTSPNSEWKVLSDPDRDLANFVGWAVNLEIRRLIVE